MSDHHIMIIIPSGSYRAGAFMDAAAVLDIPVVVGSDHKQVLAGLVEDATIFLPLNNHSKCIRVIAEYHRRHPLEVIIGVDELSVVVAAKASAALGLPGNSVESVEATRNKYRMRQAFTKSDAPTPDFSLFSLDDDPEEFAQELVYPAVLKPTFLAMSRGVMRVDNPEECVEGFRKIVDILRKSNKGLGSETQEVLVEDFIHGPEVALEGMVTEGELQTFAIFDKPDPMDGPVFVETIYVTPSRFSAPLQQVFEDTTQAGVKALGIEAGPIHAELRFNDSGVWIIEIAARSIGGLCSRALRFNDGTSLEEAILRHALREDISGCTRESLASGVMMIPVPKQGIFRGVGGQDYASLLPGIDDLIVSIPPNTPVEPLPGGGKYLGFIFARADSPEDVEHSLREAHQHLDIKID